MTDNNNLTPPPELVQQWRTEVRHQDYWTTIEHVAAQAARWGDEQRLRACIELLDINGCPDRYINMLRDGGPQPQPQPSLKEQALDRCNDYIDPDGIIRRALEQLPDGPDVTHSIGCEHMGGPIHAGTVTTHTVAKAPEPAAAPDRPLWWQMWQAYLKNYHDKISNGYAAELRVVADWLEREQTNTAVFRDLDDVIYSLRAEAERAEAGE